MSSENGLSSSSLELERSDKMTEDVAQWNVWLFFLAAYPNSLISSSVSWSLCEIQLLRFSGPVTSFTQSRKTLIIGGAAKKYKQLELFVLTGLI